MIEATDTKIVVIEQDVPHPPEKVWRDLTEGALIEEWLMKNDFKPVVGHQFDFRGDWGAVNCKVLTVVPHKELSYTWDALGLKSIVTWTLARKSTGTHLRMQQSGFRADQQQAYQGAQYGWKKFIAELEMVLGRLA